MVDKKKEKNKAKRNNRSINKKIITDKKKDKLRRWPTREIASWPIFA